MKCEDCNLVVPPPLPRGMGKLHDHDKEPGECDVCWYLHNCVALPPPQDFVMAMAGMLASPFRFVSGKAVPIDQEKEAAKSRAKLWHDGPVETCPCGGCAVVRMLSTGFCRCSEHGEAAE